MACASPEQRGRTKTDAGRERCDGSRDKGQRNNDARAPNEVIYTGAILHPPRPFLTENAGWMRCFCFERGVISARAEGSQADTEEQRDGKGTLLALQIGAVAENSPPPPPRKQTTADAAVVLQKQL